MKTLEHENSAAFFLSPEDFHIGFLPPTPCSLRIQLRAKPAACMRPPKSLPQDPLVSLFPRTAFHQHKSWKFNLLPVPKRLQKSVHFSSIWVTLIILFVSAVLCYLQRDSFYILSRLFFFFFSVVLYRIKLCYQLLLVVSQCNLFKLTVLHI